MAVQTITYDDKQYLNQNADIPATNKVQDTDMNEIKSVVNNNAQEVTNITGQILWTNSNPTSTFYSQTIQLDMTNYNKFEIICRLSTSNDLRICQTVYKDSTYRLLIPGYETDDNVFVRNVTISNSTISIGNCSGYGVANKTTFTLENNNALIPIQIIGYKTGLFN